MGILLGSVLVIIPLIFVPGVLFYFDITPKIVVLLCGAAGALLAAGAARQGFRTLMGSAAGRALLYLAAAGVVSIAISSWTSVDPALSLTGTNWRRFGLVSWLAIVVLTLAMAAYVCENGAGARRLIRLMALAGLPAALYGISQYFGWDPLLPRQAYLAGDAPWTIVRPPSTLGHADYFGIWLLYPVFAGLALNRGDAQRVWRLTGAASASAGVLALILSGTRAAVLGLAAGALFLLWDWRPRPGRRGLSLAVAAVAAAVAFYWLPPGAALRNRVKWSVDDALGGARLMLWRDTLKMAYARPWFGYGPESFSLVFPHAMSVELARAYPDFHHESPHNMFLDVLAQQGLAGLAVLVGLISLALYSGRRVLKRPNNDPTATAMLACFLAALVSQQFAVLTAPTALYLAATIAVLVGGSIESPIIPAGGRSFSRWVLPVAFLPASVLFLLFALRLLAYDRNLAVTRQRVDAGDIAGAINVHRDARRWQPPGASSDLWYSRAMWNAAMTTTLVLPKLLAVRESWDAAVRATATAEDRPDAFYSLAALYATRNDAANVEASLRRSIEWSPNWFKPHWLLAKLLAAERRYSEAQAEAARAALLNGGKNPEVVQTEEEIRRSLH